MIELLAYVLASAWPTTDLNGAERPPDSPPR